MSTLLATGARIVAAVTCCMICGCGGSSPSLQSISKPTGIEGTGLMHTMAFRTGPISRFGSVFVNGVEFSVAQAQINIDGAPALVGELRPGETVTASGSIDPSGSTGTATEIDAYTDAEGSVGAVDIASSKFTVLGQPILVGPNTTFAGYPVGAPTPCLATLATGTLVRVSAAPGPAGTFVATRVEVEGAAAEYIVSGVVEQLHSPAARFSLNGVPVDYSTAVLAGFAANGGLQNGETVQVTTAPAQPAGAISASRLQFIGYAPNAPGADAGLRGVISRFAGPGDFDVDGVHVVASTQTVFQGQGNGLALNTRVDVHGTIDATGTVTATAVDDLGIDPLLVSAAVQSVDAATNSLTVLGIPVTVTATTRFVDDTPAAATPFNLASIQAGDYVEIHGQAAGNAGIAASTITRESAPDGAGAEVMLRGPATAVDAPDLTVLGIPAVTSDETRFQNAAENADSTDQFFATARRAIVTVQGSMTDGTLNVTSAGLTNDAEVDD